MLGVVTDRYRVVQNTEAFAFTDALLGEGVKYETAGSLQNGRKIWLLAKLPDRYIIEGDQVEPYLVFSNSHDGSGSIKVAMTPVRVVCQNTLNLALASAKRVWSTIHVGDLAGKMDEAHNTLLLAEKYMGQLGMEFSRLSKIKLSDQKVLDYIDLLLPMDDQPTDIHRKNMLRLREDVKRRYFEAPDLRHVGKERLPVPQRCQRLCHPCQAPAGGPPTTGRTCSPAPWRATRSSTRPTSWYWQLNRVC